MYLYTPTEHVVVIHFHVLVSAWCRHGTLTDNGAHSLLLHRRHWTLMTALWWIAGGRR